MVSLGRFVIEWNDTAALQLVQIAIRGWMLSALRSRILTRSASDERLQMAKRSTHPHRFRTARRLTASQDFGIFW